MREEGRDEIEDKGARDESETREREREGRLMRATMERVMGERRPDDAAVRCWLYTGTKNQSTLNFLYIYP